MKEKYLKFCDYVARACGAFAVLALLLSILVIVELVFERYFFQRAITWQTELVTMLLVASTFIGSAYVLSEKAQSNLLVIDASEALKIDGVVGFVCQK